MMNLLALLLAALAIVVAPMAFVMWALGWRHGDEGPEEDDDG